MTSPSKKNRPRFVVIVAKFTWLWLIVCQVNLATTFLYSESSPNGILRIAILEKVPSFNIGSEKDFVLTDTASGETESLSSKNIFLVKAGNKGISIGGNVYQNSIRFITEENSLLRVDGKKYRGSILVRQNEENQLTVINEIGLDEYIYGILPREISPNWPKESLKAQAVVSRTYALRNLSRHNGNGFNLCSKVHCQVYGGADCEDSQTNKAVDETHNEVITYDGDLINSVFFANCGGRTELPKNAWNSDFSPPYLKTIHCRYCKKSRHYHWENLVSEDDIYRALKRNSYAVKPPISSISIYSEGKSGRASTLRIKNGNGELRIRASHFRLAVGAEIIRSTLLSKIKKTRKGFYFKGKGWGHGIGFCQDGAKGFAEKGADYKKIIRFYYPGVKIESP